jgi:catechol 2,3-dioxygenase-like lactoylglutathione lyase family enzyme
MLSATEENMRRVLLAAVVFSLLAGSLSGQNKVKSIDHIVINVSEMERALAFYKRIGFTLLNEDGWRKGQGQVAIKISDTQKINVHKEETLGPALKKQATGSDDRFSLALVPVVGGADFCVVWDGTVEEAQQHLRKSGVESISAPRRVSGGQGPGTSVYFRDPDGNLWEFVTYGKP